MHPKVLVLISVAVAAGSSAIMAQESAVVTSTTYLALGDSLATGFNPFIFPPDFSRYAGYPLFVSSAVQQKVANASCPGETSSSFIDGRSALPGFVCGANARAVVYGPNGPVSMPLQLGVPYNGARTQLEYAVGYLRMNPNAKLVTINIGGNDFAPLLTCKIGCEIQAALLLTRFTNNLTLIFTALRSTGYKGPIIAANYYAFNYKDPKQVGPLGAFTALNTVIATVTTLFGGRVADVFSAFKSASGEAGDPCAAGLLLKTEVPGATGCDTHPNATGQGLIAAAVTYQIQR